MNKKYKSWIALFLIGSLFTACSSEESLEVPQPADGSLLAQIESIQPNSRISFTTEGNLFWSEGDNLAVSSKGNTAFYSFALKKGDEGKSSGSFSGLTEGGMGSYAMYPYHSSSQINGTNLIYVYPTEYDYSKVDETIPSAPSAGCNSILAPMAGSISSSSVKLHHLGGLIRVVVEKMPSTEGDFIFKADANITGAFKTVLSSPNAMLSLHDPTAVHGQTVTIHFGTNSAVLGKKGVFYIPLPVGTYHKLELGFDADRNGEADFMTTIEETITLQRAKIEEWHLQSFNFGGDPGKENNSDANA